DFGNIAAMVAATGIEARYVDGRDVLAVADVSRSIIDRVREDGRPAFLECGVFRVRPHSFSDPDYRYRDRNAGEAWLASNDPILLLRRRLAVEHQQELDAIDAEVEALVAATVAETEADEPTPLRAATLNIYATPELSDD